VYALNKVMRAREEANFLRFSSKQKPDASTAGTDESSAGPKDQHEAGGSSDDASRDLSGEAGLGEADDPSRVVVADGGTSPADLFGSDSADAGSSSAASMAPPVPRAFCATPSPDPEQALG
jgi:hypothetical protein